MTPELAAKLIYSWIASLDDDIAAFPSDVRTILQEVRARLGSAVPAARLLEERSASDP